MATPAPPGLYPIFLRGVTCEKFGLKTGEGVNDVVDYKYIPKEDITKEIQTMGKMSDFEPAKKVIEGYNSETILFVVDREQKYGETFLICYTDESRDEYLRGIMETQEALREQLKAEMQAEEDRRAAEFARLNVVYEDKPILPRPWIREGANGETENEISLTSQHTTRELISIEVSRPKRFTRQKYQFTDKTAEVGGVAEFRGYKDPGFKPLREADCGIQVAPTCAESGAQTTWYRSVNKSIQYEAASIGTDAAEVENLDAMLSFLERATVQVEHALQQNESVDIFNETFRLLGDDDVGGGAQADNELRELKNFADPTYSKFKALAAIDWVPKVNGMVAVSAVRNISFDQRIPIIGQTHTSYVLLWDFRLLVKPLILMQSHHEIFTFRFNRIDPNLVAGGCITGQVVLWETSGAIAAAQQKNNRGASSSSAGAASVDHEEEDLLAMPVAPKYVSHVDFGHKKCVADLFWLPPTTQINYRGRLVGDEHLDGKSYQFVTIAGDGLIMVWDIRYEQIFNDELRHIGRAKHVPTEKSNNKESGGVKPLWGPIFKAHLKRLEGVGELSLCKLSPTTNMQSGAQVLNKPSHFGGDSRSQFTIATEEGDVIFTDLSARKAEHTKDEEEEEEAEFSCVKWITVDHPRPSVCLQESPFFPQIVLSVSDWNFHLWKIGEDKPLFVSPLSPTYLTAGAWSTTRPAVLYIACADGQILVWDFTDSSFRPSIELKATHSKIASMEFLASSTSSRQQLLAVGDDLGTLHIFEVPRNLTRPVHKEESIMFKFLERELQRIEFSKDAPAIPHNVPTHELHAETAAPTNANTGAPPSRAGTADVRTTTRDGRPTTADTVGTGGLTEAEIAQNKEEEEFLKLESIFITELGLHKDQLPGFARPAESTTT